MDSENEEPGPHALKVLCTSQQIIVFIVLLSKIELFGDMPTKHVVH